MRGGGRGHGLCGGVLEGQVPTLQNFCPHNSCSSFIHVWEVSLGSIHWFLGLIQGPVHAVWCVLLSVPPQCTHFEPVIITPIPVLSLVVPSNQ